MSEENVLVSVIMPAYNADRFIGSAIDSVISQTYANWELLICDDGSTDQTASIITNFASDDARIILVDRVGPKGAPSARNSCLERASGRYIAFLDSDDLWRSDKLEKQITCMSRDNINFCFSSYQCLDEDGSYRGVLLAPPAVGYNLMLVSNFVGCLTVVYDRDFFGEIRQPNIKKRNDYALWLVMFKDRPGLRSRGLIEPLASYRVNSYGLSSDKGQAVVYYWKCIRDFGGVGPLRSVLLLAAYLTVMLIKKIFPSSYNYIVIKLKE